MRKTVEPEVMATLLTESSCVISAHSQYITNPYRCQYPSLLH